MSHILSYNHISYIFRVLKSPFDYPNKLAASLIFFLQDELYLKKKIKKTVEFFKNIITFETVKINK